MADERWKNPFGKSIAFILFNKHFTELNNIYWAHIPVRNTIKKQVKLIENDKNILEFFLVADKDDKHIANSFTNWSNHYGDFDNYTRLNMLMLLCSTLETYLRTIISLAVESKPGLLLNSQDAIDGVFLLKSDPNYGNYNSKCYQFTDIIEAICVGDWQKRVEAYKKYFKSVPCFLTKNIKGLDELRQTRNSVGHFFGRDKTQYEIPLLLEAQPVMRVSHEKLIKYFSLVFETVKNLDKHLLDEYIGSYDILKFYITNLDNKMLNLNPGQQAKSLQKYLGQAGLMPVGTEYYQNLLSYYHLDDKDQQCRYSGKICVREIKKIIKGKGVSLHSQEGSLLFTSKVFKQMSKKYKFKENPEYCIEQYGTSKYYLYSKKAIDFIVEIIIKSPELMLEV